MICWRIRDGISPRLRTSQKPKIRHIYSREGKSKVENFVESVIFIKSLSFNSVRMAGNEHVIQKVREMFSLVLGNHLMDEDLD